MDFKMVAVLLVFLAVSLTPGQCDLDYPYNYQVEPKQENWYAPLATRSSSYYDENHSERLLLVSGIVSNNSATDSCW